MPDSVSFRQFTRTFGLNGVNAILELARDVDVMAGIGHVSMFTDEGRARRLAADMLRGFAEMMKVELGAVEHADRTGATLDTAGAARIAELEWKAAALDELLAAYRAGSAPGSMIPWYQRVLPVLARIDKEGPVAPARTMRERPTLTFGDDPDA